MIASGSCGLRSDPIAFRWEPRVRTAGAYIVGPLFARSALPYNNERRPKRRMRVALLTLVDHG